MRTSGLSKPSIDALLPCGFAAVSQEFVLRFAEACPLGGEAAASAIRDGIGRGLKRFVVCRDSPNCKCPYCLYFKPAPPLGYSGGVSPGYVLSLVEAPRKIEAGESIRLRITCLGSAAQALPWFIAALLHCGQVGIGSPKVSFSADAAGECTVSTLESLKQRAQELAGVSECAIEFVAPCILRSAGRLLDTIDFRRLLKAIIERLQPNVAYWCGGWMSNAERDRIASKLLAAAGGICSAFRTRGMVHEVARSFDGERKSLTGFVGRLQISGDLEPFWPFLLIGELVHIGSYPQLDRGRYQIKLD